VSYFEIVFSVFGAIFRGKTPVEERKKMGMQ
jgi:hypothetical protein